MADPALSFAYMDSPVGTLLLAGDADALHIVSFSSGGKAFGPRPEWVHADNHFTEAKRQLAAYFAGELRNFELPLKFNGTAFQTKVWTALRAIPYGETRTYGWIAQDIGAPAASRAVGAANGANPLPIIVPCHRVVGANGALTGFGGGIETKKYLLDHETARPGRAHPPQ
jgi:methylated-DNA-[protein]-cysteine S-methyltransferase